jgi:hypothetical protein
MSDIDITGSISNEPTITGQFEPDIVIQGNVDSQFPAQVSVASVTTGDPGTDAAVVNVGTPGNARLQFTIPRGDKGEQGDTGPQGIQGETGPAGADSTVPGPAGADGVVQSLVAGSNITIDATDPANPVINSTASGSGDVVGPASAVDGTPMVADGTTGKLLKNITYTAFKALLSLVKGDVGLGNVDNTADSAKSVLSATKLSTARNIDGQSFDGTAAITVIAPGTHAATGKNTPVDADEFAIVDSAASNVLKKLTWANLKATIAAYLVSAGWIREKLTANRTYYVRSDGSDSNNGLANNSGGAFLTIQKAVDTAAALDIAGFAVTIQIADATYSAGAVLKNVVGFAAPGNLVIQGNNTTPSNTLISTAAANSHGFIADTISSVWDIKDLKIQTSTATSNALVAQGGAALRYGNIDFGSCNGIHIQAFGPGSTITCLSNYAVSGSAAAHYQSYYGAQIIAPSKTITITGTLSIGFWADMRVLGSGQLFSQTFSGTYTVTGTRYRSSENAVIFVNGAGATYFPGNVNGTPATGGLYT